MKKHIIGALENIYLPTLNLQVIARVDTGATTSSLHVDEYEIINNEDGENKGEFVRFSHSFDGGEPVSYCLPLLKVKKVISSNGKAEHRPVVATEIKLSGRQWLVKFTLTNRERMRYPMLLGRETMGKKFLIDPSVHFIAED